MLQLRSQLVRHRSRLLRPSDEPRRTTLRIVDADFKAVTPAEEQDVMTDCCNGNRCKPILLLSRTRPELLGDLEGAQRVP